VSDLASRLAVLARGSGVAPDERQLRAVEHYLNLLSHWNSTINLTSLTLDGFPDATLNRLIAEPLVASRFVAMRPVAADREGAEHSRLSWADLGSGGGSPAIPLKIVRPDLRLTMVESRERKCAFLREVVRELGLSEASVFAGRMEDTRDVNVDLITVRGVSWNKVLADTVSRMLASDGRLLVLGSSAPRLPGMELEIEAPLISAGDRLFIMRRST
jgi:16S rRNA (guanine527-N7)-methyltransferase